MPKNDPADGVFAHREHPDDHKCDEDPITGSGEASAEAELVNAKRIRYSFLYLGVPPSLFLVNFQNWYMRGTPSFCKH